VSEINTRDAVVILLDCMEGTAKGSIPDPAQRRLFSQSVLTLIEAAHQTGAPVIRVDVEFRRDHVEIAESNKFFSGVKAAGRLLADSEHTKPMAEFSEAFTDMVRVVKRRIGAFAGSDLEWVLRGLGKTHLILAGLVTRGAVLSTACLAADLDYRVTIAGDACHDPDPEVHRILLASVLPLRASILSVAEVEAALRAGANG
jgi:nicotinamidase-related amidase